MLEHFVVYGAGAIGATIGARLHMAGHSVTFIARGDHGAKLAEDGLTFIAPDGTHKLQISTVLRPAEVPWDKTPAKATIVLLCMKSQHTEDALRDLAGAAPHDVAVACMQNGVANERLALRYFARVVATVVNLPATHLDPGIVVTHAAGQGGVLDSGCYPQGSDATVVSLTDALSGAGFSARPDPAVMRFKYAKLLMNLGNVLQAGIPLDADTTELARSARREALACYAAADIDCAPRDEVRARQADTYRLVPIEGYPRAGGSSWQSMSRGAGDIETEFLNGEISLLGRLHGVPTPVNDACVRMGRALIASGAGPGQFSVDKLHAMISDA